MATRSTSQQRQAGLIAAAASLFAAKGFNGTTTKEIAKAAGVYVFGGGIDEDVLPALVSADGAVAEGGYPWAPPLDGGFTVLELRSREEAVAWAARIAKADVANSSCAASSPARSHEREASAAGPTTRCGALPSAGRAPP